MTHEKLKVRHVICEMLWRCICTPSHEIRSPLYASIVSVIFNRTSNRWFCNQVIIYSLSTDVPQPCIKYCRAELAPCSSWLPDSCTLKLPNLSWILWLLCPLSFSQAQSKAWDIFMCFVLFFLPWREADTQILSCGNKRNRCPKNSTSICFTLLWSQMRKETV